MRRALEGLEGVESVEMRFDDKEFDVVHDGRVTAEELAGTVIARGFETRVVTSTAEESE